MKHLGRGAVVACLVTLSTSATAAEPTETATEKEHRPERGPADALVVEAGFGWGVAALTAIQGHDPKVTHGPAFHLGAGWAWTMTKTFSLGVELFGDAMIDRDNSTKEGSALGRRIGVAAFLAGERAHLRVGAGAAKSTFEGADYTGFGVAFAVGAHFAILDLQTWKRPMLTIDFVPSWDFLNAGNETLNRPSASLVLGLAAY